LYHWINQKI